MSNNQILISSDHHANWSALEKLFQLAKEKNIPFIINGDIIGDYNFELLADQLKLKFPYEIEQEKLKKLLGEEIFEQYMIYSQIKQNGGDPSFLLHQVPEHLKQETINKLQNIVNHIESSDFQKKIKNLNIENKTKHIISNHKIQLQTLYQLIVKFHAKDFAELIDKYEVETYFLNGNHEPIYFPNLVLSNLKNKTLFKNLGDEKGISNINGFKVCGVSNVSAVMPFLHHLYSENELDKKFLHQRGIQRPILFRNVTTEHLNSTTEHESDFDWIRIMENKKKDEIDVFITHGQIGIGAWRDDKNCNEMPTLHVAAMLSSLSKITVDGHLHTTHTMKNPLGIETIRAVGNKAFLLTKNNEKIEKELIEIDAPYDSRGKYDLSDHDIKKLILDEVFQR